MVELPSAPSRRLLLAGLAGAGLVSAAGAGTPAAAATGSRTGSHADGLTDWPDLPDEAHHSLDRLVAGNRRFLGGHTRHPNQSVRWAASLASGQHPFATVLGCVDSRVPVEIVTDQGVGDLFPARTAGHVLDDAVLGSLEYGVEHLKIPLLIVLGHESCGAVTAAIETVDAGGRADGAIQYLVDAIRPSVLATEKIADPKARVDATVRAHARATAKQLTKVSKIIREAVHAGELGIVAARYDLDRLALTPA